MLWTKTWGSSDYESGYGLALDGSGNAFITGYTYGYGAGGSDAFVLKYNSDGNLLWNNTWGGSDSDSGRGIALDGSGNVFITGYTNHSGEGYDAFLLKYDSAGNQLWYKTWGGSEYDDGRGIAVDSSGTVFITGSTRSFGEGFDDIFFLKYEVDSDEDGLSDNKEVNIYFTDPNNSDTDDDGFTDGEEVNSGTDPLNFIDNWLSRGVLISISITALIIVCYVVIRKNKVKKINIIMERGDKLKTQADLEKSIESYQEALLKTNNVIKFVPKSVRSLIKGKLDQTLELQINQLLEKCDKLKKEGEYIGSIESINLASNLTKKIKEKSIKEQFNSKIINILDQIYVEIVNVKIEEALKLREMKNFDESINNFNTALSDVDKIGDKQLKEKFQSILKDYIDTTRMIRIKNLIFDLGQNYARLDVSDIIEKCGEGEGFILSAIRDMIMNREISAEYFKSNNTVTFKKQVDVEEIDKLMKSFDEWEKEGKSKKK
jgi:tetratricopeptide (TPR) repeat protein